MSSFTLSSPNPATLWHYQTFHGKLSFKPFKIKQTTLIIHPPTVKQLDAVEYWSPVWFIFLVYFNLKRKWDIQWIQYGTWRQLQITISITGFIVITIIVNSGKYTERKYLKPCFLLILCFYLILISCYFLKILGIGQWHQCSLVNDTNAFYWV